MGKKDAEKREVGAGGKVGREKRDGGGYGLSSG